MSAGLALMSAFAIWAAVSIYDDHRQRKAAAKPSSEFVTAGGVPVRVYDQDAARELRELRAARSLEVRARDARKDREVRELERLVNLPAYQGGRGHYQGRGH